MPLGCRNGAQVQAKAIHVQTLHCYIDGTLATFFNGELDSSVVYRASDSRSQPGDQRSRSKHGLYYVQYKH